MSLILDNCYAADESVVRAVPCPAPTKSWAPISHGEAIDETLKAIDRTGLRVTDARYALSGNKKKSNGDTRLFGEMVLEGGSANVPGDFRMAIGIRNSIDRSISYNICGGESVMVCGNMCFHGDFMEKRKHTVNIREHLPGLIDGALGRYLMDFGKRIDQVEFWKDMEIEDRDASHAIIECVRQNVLPANRVKNVLEEYENPHHEEFKSRTVWSLHNAFTEAHKTHRADPNILADNAINMTRTLGEMFPASVN